MKSVDVLIGLQWGDEGKGKIVDFLAPEYDIIARFQGGPNAGHTLEFNGEKHIMHSIPSGIFHPAKINIIGNGVVFDPVIFNKEISELISCGLNPSENLYIYKRTHFILPVHRLLDAALEKAKGTSKIGSTLKGIGPAYTDKYARHGLRIGDIDNYDFIDKYNNIKKLQLKNFHSLNFDENDFLIDNLPFLEYEKLWLETIELIKHFKRIDGEIYINEQIKNGKTILAEGAQGTLLDVDFGSYPYVTSSNTVASAACTGLGISPSHIRKIFGVFKAYCTRVGSGPFPTEQDNETGEMLRTKGNEYGSTTGRPRRCGWLDLPALQYATTINAVDALFMMKVDALDNLEQIPVCSAYAINDEIIEYLPFNLENPELKPVYTNFKGWNNFNNQYHLPEEFVNYIKYIEKKTNTPISLVSMGADRSKTIVLYDFMK